MKGNQSLLPMTVATVLLAKNGELVKGVEIKWAGRVLSFSVEDWKMQRVFCIVETSKLVPTSVVNVIDMTVDGWDECALEDEMMLEFAGPQGQEEGVE